MKFTLSLKQTYSKRKKNQELGLTFTPLHYDAQTHLRLMAQKVPWDISGYPRQSGPSCSPPSPPPFHQPWGWNSDPTLFLLLLSFFSCSQNGVRAKFFQVAFPWPCGSPLGITHLIPCLILTDFHLPLPLQVRDATAGQFDTNASKMSSWFEEASSVACPMLWERYRSHQCYLQALLPAEFSVNVLPW